jgi:glucose-1-phosphate thymidylyltransferase
MRLIIPMGGRGTRLRPFSHTLPKPLLPLLGRPVVSHILDAFAGALGRPVDEVVFVLGPEAGAGVRHVLAAACASHGLSAAFAVQPEPLGTAHAIACAGEKLEGEVLTCWADTLFTADAGTDLQGADLVAWTVEVEDPRRFGIVERDESGRVVRLVEKPQRPTSRETLIGAYYVRDGAALRQTIEAMIEAGATGAGGEYQLTDAFDHLVRDSRRMVTAPASRWLDVGTLESYRHTVRVLLEAGEYHASQAGDDVVIVPPAYVDPSAVVRRSVVGPYASVEAGAVVEDSVIRDAVLMAEAEVRGAVLAGALLGSRARATGVTGSIVLGDDSDVEGATPPEVRYV